MDVRATVVLATAASIATPVFAQTQPTRQSAYPTYSTMRSGWPTAALNPCPKFGFNPNSSCYSGSVNPSFSAIAPSETPQSNSKAKSKRTSDNLYQGEARLRIEEKGYLDVTLLDKDNRGVWRGKARLSDGRAVDVTLDLDGNVYSVPSRLQIRIEPPRSEK